MYDLIGYGDMIADDVRRGAYARALHAVLRPDSVVLDIGTGTGLFALLACRFGARHVYAVEPGEAIALARELARANGCEDRITFIQRRSERVTLPEPVDVVVADIRGVLPLYQRSVAVVLDARRRLLAPGGTLIPRRDRLMVAPVDAPALYAKHTGPWSAPFEGIDGCAARRYALNTWHRGRARPQQLLAAPVCWGELDYAEIDRPDLRGAAEWIAARAGRVNGLCVWFDTELTPGIGYSNAPDRPELVYGSAFFPLMEPVALEPGDGVHVALRADLVGEDYTWTWRTTIRGAGGSDPLKARFDQSTFFSLPIGRMQLARRAATHRPRLSEEGEVALFVLGAMREGLTLEQIAREACARFPSRFPDWQTALGHVGAFSGEYGDDAVGHDGVEDLATRATRS